MTHTEPQPTTLAVSLSAIARSSLFQIGSVLLSLGIVNIFGRRKIIA
jgi:hypothetical protein